MNDTTLTLTLSELEIFYDLDNLTPRLSTCVLIYQNRAWKMKLFWCQGIFSREF